MQKKRKRRTILILEDAGSESQWVCDFVSRLVEEETQFHPGLMIILLRQTKFNQLIDEVSLDSLSYRVAKHIVVTPFTLVETRKFIRWRIDAAESANMARIFDLQALTLIHELCEGMPDAVEHLCCESLELAENEDTAPVTTKLVMRAHKALPVQSATGRRQSKSPVIMPEIENIPILKPPEFPTIVLTYNGKKVCQVPVSKQRISIGRGTDNDLCIDSPFISRQHAAIVRNGAETAVVDLDSKNGTFVNSKQIRIQTVADQDEISIGYHIIRYLDPNAPRIRSMNSIRRGSPIPAGKVHSKAHASTAQNASRARR